MIEVHSRVAVLWTSLSGYLNACLRALVENHGVELHVTRIQRPGRPKHPYDEQMFAWLPRLETLPSSEVEFAPAILEQLARFQPDAVLVSGWSSPAYRKVARDLRAQSHYVIGTADNPWHGSPRQRVGVLASRWYVQPLFDALWVPGERGASFARRLGFTGERLLYGLYSADRPRFAPVAAQRHLLDNAAWPHRFLFAGRLAPEKGIADLVTAYSTYRLSVAAPWELLVAGTGGLEHMVSGVEGITPVGFVQPEDYPALLAQAGIFVLPSHYDPWPLVIHEMTSAGLPILCSRQCGSSVELVQDGLNGHTFEAGDVDGLTRLLTYMASGEVDLACMSRHSVSLAGRYSPEQWAAYLVGHLRRFARSGSRGKHS